MAPRGAATLAVLAVAAALAAASAPEAAAQAQIGGVDLEGEWHVGEGLGVGDYFSYNVCHISYRECKEFRLDFWIEGDRDVGGESKWIARVVVHDGAKVAKGTMELGKVAPEPTGSSESIKTYSGVYKSSIAWLSAFATAYGGAGGEGPKAFSDPSWGKIGNIGGEQILPKEVASVRVRGGTFDESVVVAWRTGGAESRVWVVDGFPFPVQAGTWAHVSEGIPPQEYRFELLDYGNSGTNPYAGIEATEEGAAAGCPEDPGLATTKRTTAGGRYLIKASHGPEEPVARCDMTLLLSFHSKYDETEFLNQVQYDILVADPAGDVVHTASEAEGSRVLYSGSGQVRNDEMWVPDEPGEYTYAIVVRGLAPSNTLTRPAELDSLQIPITVVANAAAPAPTEAPARPAAAVPAWIKETAGFWVDGHIGDAEFVAAIEFLISRGIIEVGATGYGAPGGAGVPAWVKETAGFWVDGQTDDSTFVAAIEFLVGRGIIAVG